MDSQLSNQIHHELRSFTVKTASFSLQMFWHNKVELVVGQLRNRQQPNVVRLQHFYCNVVDYVFSVVLMLGLKCSIVNNNNNNRTTYKAPYIIRRSN